MFYYLIFYIQHIIFKNNIHMCIIKLRLRMSQNKLIDSTNIAQNFYDRPIRQLHIDARGGYLSFTRNETSLEHCELILTTAQSRPLHDRNNMLRSKCNTPVPVADGEEEGLS